MGKAIGGLPEAPALRSGDPAAPSKGVAGRSGASASGASASGAGGERLAAIGAYLARQRRLRGISLDELAALTRIPVRSLERLEGGAYDGQPDGFVRGFVRTVAAAIGLDPEETVARMLPEARLRRSGMPTRWRQALLLLGLLTLGAIVSAGGLSWWQSRPSEGPAPEALPLRRDAVRALAIEQGLLAPGEPAVPRPLPPVAEPVPSPTATPDALGAPGEDAAEADAAPPRAKAVEGEPAPGVPASP